MEESRRLNLTCIAADKRGECHQGQGCKTGGQGKGKMLQVQGDCTHNRLGWCKRGRVPTSQMSCVKDNLEFPRGCSNGDVTHIEKLHGKGGSG